MRPPGEKRIVFHLPVYQFYTISRFNYNARFRYVVRNMYINNMLCFNYNYLERSLIKF